MLGSGGWVICRFSNLARSDDTGLSDEPSGPFSSGGAMLYLRRGGDQVGSGVSN